MAQGPKSTFLDKIGYVLDSIDLGSAIVWIFRGLFSTIDL